MKASLRTEKAAARGAAPPLLKFLDPLLYGVVNCALNISFGPWAYSSAFFKKLKHLNEIKQKHKKKNISYPTYLFEF